MKKLCIIVCPILLVISIYSLIFVGNMLNFKNEITSFRIAESKNSYYETDDTGQYEAGNVFFYERFDLYQGEREVARISIELYFEKYSISINKDSVIRYKIGDIINSGSIIAKHDQQEYIIDKQSRLINIIYLEDEIVLMLENFQDFNSLVPVSTMGIESTKDYSFSYKLDDYTIELEVDNVIYNNKNNIYEFLLSNFVFNYRNLDGSYIDILVKREFPDNLIYIPSRFCMYDDNGLYIFILYTNINNNTAYRKEYLKNYEYVSGGITTTDSLQHKPIIIVK